MRTRSPSISLSLLSLLPFVLAQSSNPPTSTSTSLTTLYGSSTSSSSPSSTSTPMGAGAQNATYLDGLIDALNTLNLGALVNVTRQINQTDVGSELLAALSENSQNRQLTVFAPTNDAFAGVPSNISSNASLLADVISYHFVYGNFTNLTQSYPNTTVGRTMLNDMSLVELEGGKSQVLAWSRMSGGNVTVLNQNTAVSVTQQTQYENLHINVVDAVIDIPGSLEAALVSNNLTAVGTILSNVQTSNGQGSLMQYLNDDAKGFTLFAPTDAAIAAVQSQLSSFGNDGSTLLTVLGNHILNGTSAYTPSFVEQNYTSAAGEALDFKVNGTGVFVLSGNGSVSAMVTKPDVILRNGVVHIIDAVLVDTNSDTGAASSAYASATSQAAQSTTETGPVGSTPTVAGGSGSRTTSGHSSTSTSSGNGGSSGAGRVEGVVGAVVLGVVGVVVGLL